jgi:hypothetical protein
LWPSHPSPTENSEEPKNQLNMNKKIKFKPKTIVLFFSALISTINYKSYAADLSPYQKLFEYLFTKPEIPTKSGSSLFSVS